ncbi:MAG: aspartate aminotransferase family protein [Promethearchaeota archaeon]
MHISDKFSKIIEQEKIYYPLFSKKEFVAIRGKGALLYDEAGNEYIDCVAGHAVMNIGHCHPKFIQLMKKQLEKIVFVPPDFPTEERASLLDKLTHITPKKLSCVFLSNSGTESIEAAIKLILSAKREIKRPEIIAFKRAFHGRTLGSLALTHNMRYRKPYLPWLTPNVKFASFGDIDSVKNLITDHTVGIVIELIQGEGGIYCAPEEFPKELRELCDEKDLILVIDEVQTGFGRTGKMFAFEHYGIEPDILCLAKAIAGGFPMGATLSTDDIFSRMKPGEHGTTYGGNPFACAAANAAIDIIMEEKLVENAAKQGKKMLLELKAFSEEKNHVIREVRGKGLMIGVEYRMKVKELIQRAEKLGVLLLNAGLTVIRLLPPLVLTDEQVKKIINVMLQIST